MIDPAFFIDGHMEFKIIQKICPNKVVRRIGLNGRVEISAIAAKVAFLIKSLSNRKHPYVVLIDREERGESCEEIRLNLIRELRKQGIRDELCVGVSDRMIENWILADWDSFTANIGITAVRPATIEGVSGKGLIRKYFKEYHETTDGVELFTKSDPSAISLNSASFDNFARNCSILKCPWLSSGSLHIPLTVDRTTSARKG